MGLHTYSYCHWQLHNGLLRNHEFTFQNLLGLHVIKSNLATILEEDTRVNDVTSSIRLLTFPNTASDC